MSCESKREDLREAQQVLELINAELDVIQEKSTTMNVGTYLLCLVGTIGAAELAGIEGLVGGGLACAAASIAAISTVYDLEAVTRQAEVAQEHVSDARRAWMMCLSKHEMGADRNG